MQDVTDTTSAPPGGERQRLMRDAMVNNLWAPVSLIVGLLLVPLMLKSLGQDSYGLWAVATSMSGIAGAIDFGLYLSICRVVAADPAGTDSGNTGFVRSAANVYALVGIIGCIALGAAGVLSGVWLHLPPVGHETAVTVFCLVGAAFLAERTGAAGYAVLAGFRRFDLMNLLAGAGAIAWAAGVVTVLAYGGGVVAVAVCQLAVAALKSVATLWLAARLGPEFSFRPGCFRWSSFRTHLSFALSSLLTDLMSNISWNSAPVLIGLVSGPAAVVPFYVALKFPQAVLLTTWRAADVLFPAAAGSSHDHVLGGEVLRAGSRLVMVVALPLSVLMFLAAPQILQSWVGTPPPGSVSIMRVLSVAVLADTVMSAPFNLLFGRGRVRPILITDGTKTIGLVVLSLALIYPLGAEGAAWGMLIPISACSAVLFIAASRECRVDAWRVAADACRGLALPVISCAVGATALFHFMQAGRLSSVLAVAAGGAAYLLVLLGIPGNADEKRFAMSAFSRLRLSAASIYRCFSAGHERGK